MTALDQVKEKLIQLRLKIMAQRLEEVIQQAKEKNRDPLFVLNQLAEAEAEHRLQSAIRIRFQQARLSEKLTLAPINAKNASNCPHTKKPRSSKNENCGNPTWFRPSSVSEKRPRPTSNISPTPMSP